MSPTFRSNNVLYGQDEVRREGAAQFVTLANCDYSSPRKPDFAYERLKCESTNQHAAWQNRFPKNKSGTNLKNYSQFQVGEEQVTQMYN